MTPSETERVREDAKESKSNEVRIACDGSHSSLNVAQAACDTAKPFRPVVTTGGKSRSNRINHALEPILEHR